MKTSARVEVFGVPGIVVGGEFLSGTVTWDDGEVDVLDGTWVAMLDRAAVVMAERGDEGFEAEMQHKSGFVEMMMGWEGFDGLARVVVDAFYGARPTVEMGKVVDQVVDWKGVERGHETECSKVEGKE